MCTLWRMSSGISLMLKNVPTAETLLNQYELVDDAPIRDTRLLYDRCNVAILELAGYHEAMENLKWRTTMQEELFVIEKKSDLGVS